MERSRPDSPGLFLILAAGTAAFFHLRSSNVPDPDSFYHLRHAALYRAHGFFMTEFPWTAWSIIRKNAADIWYGFHVLLVPFTLAGNPGLGIKVAGILLTMGLLSSLYVVGVRHKLPAPLLWPFLVLFSGPNLLLHFTMTRPHVMTTSLCILLFSFSVVGRARAVFLLCFLLSFVHLSLFWIAPAIVIAVLGAKAFVEGLVEWHKALAALAGLAAGWFARPHPTGAAKIVYVQVVEIALEKLSGTPLLVGTELLPITGHVVAANLVPFLLLLASAAGFLVWAWAKGASAAVEPRERTWIYSSLLLSAGFLAMMIVVARRSFAPWSIFSVLFVAGVYRSFISGNAESAPALVGRRARGWIVWGAAALFALMIILATLRNGRQLANAYPPGGCKDAALWLQDHSRAGEIVYNVHWDAFPGLFLWNQKNRYINGMDPIFLYAFDHSLYYKAFYLQIGKATSFTCGVPVCTEETLKDTFTVLRRDFEASWLFIEKDRSPALYAYVRTDARFVPGFENATQAVYRLGEIPAGRRVERPLGTTE